jgi:hypothetical protein
MYGDHVAVCETVHRPRGYRDPGYIDWADIRIEHSDTAARKPLTEDGTGTCGSAEQIARGRSSWRRPAG